MLIELQACRQLVGDRLMDAGRQHPTDSRLKHFLVRLWPKDVHGGHHGRWRSPSTRQTTQGMLAFGATSIIERQIVLVREITNTLVIIANDRAYASFGVPIVADVLPGAGALGGIYTALVTATTGPGLGCRVRHAVLRAAFLRHVIVAGRRSMSPSRERPWDISRCALPIRADVCRACVNRSTRGAQDPRSPSPRPRARDWAAGDRPVRRRRHAVLQREHPDDYARAVAHLGATRQ